MLKPLKKKILVSGIKLKMESGHVLEDILATYVNLSDEEKQEVREGIIITP